MSIAFQRMYPPTQPISGPAFWLPYRGNELLIEEQGSSLIISDEITMAALNPQHCIFMGNLDDKACIACEISVDQEIPTGWQALGLRSVFEKIDEAAYAVASYALHILHWQREYRYCPTCGHLLGELSAQWAKYCTNCTYIGYPPISPAIIVLVHDGDKVLLVHKPGQGARFSLIAGFTEPGETLEECVKREVAEEAGAEITDIRYFGSQPWPFPNQLMIGFTARYVGGEIRPDEDEIDQVDWFHFEQLTTRPPAISIARQIMDKWVEERRTATSHRG